MNDLINWYWDWGALVVNVSLFLFGVFVGWMKHKEKCKRERHAEQLRLAITDTITYGSGFMKDGKHVHLEDVWGES